MRAAVLFDLDGTLIETVPEIARAVNLTLGDFDRAPIELTQIRDWIGHGTGWLMEQAWAAEPPRAINSPAWDVVMSRFVTRYFETAGTESHLYEGVADTLARLERDGIGCCIVTNKETRFTERVLEAHGLSSAFDCVISGDTLPTKKPDPAGIDECLRACGVSKDQALFVGDSLTDVRTARAAGIPVWAVPYGYNHGQPIETTEPDRVIPNITHVFDFFSSHP
jgi:phosphoglycolate phosphatase